MKTLSVPERRNKIIELLKDSGQVTVVELNKILNVSGVTVRKDLQYLDDKGLLIRTHGGDMKNDYLVLDQNFDEKGKKFSDEKRKIGVKAAEMIENGDTLIMDAGTTVMQVAKNLLNKRNLIVLTPAINIALELMRNPDIQIILLGGPLRKSSGAVIGSYAEKMIREHFCSKLFLAADGFDPSFGVTTTNTQEANLNKLMIESAQQTFVVIDSSKFGRRGLSRICGIEDIDIIITDSNITDSMRIKLENNNIRVIVV